MSHHRQQERPTCRGCRILRVELARLQRESESRAAADAQRCLAMYDHMERLARLNVALTQQRTITTALVPASSSIEVEKQVQRTVETRDQRADEQHVEHEDRVQQLQATIVQQAREIERLRRQLKSSVPLLQLDGAIGLTASDDDDDECDDHQDSEADGDERVRRRRRGLEKLPLTSLYAQLRARDAAIHRLEHHVAELTEALDASREKKSHAMAQYQQTTNSQQTQLKKCAARIEEQHRVQRESDREIDGLKAYVSVLEKKLLAKKPASERASGRLRCG